MKIEQAILERLKQLPPDKQLEVLDFAEFLHRKAAGAGPTVPRRSLKGALAHLNIKISEEDIAQARREMWGNFPRDINP